MPVYTPDLGGSTGLLTSKGAYTPLGDHSEVTISAVAQQLTVPRPLRATGVLIQAVGADILCTIDGTDPTVTPGYIIYDTVEPLYIPLNDEDILTVVRADTDDASVRYQWVRKENGPMDRTVPPIPSDLIPPDVVITSAAAAIVNAAFDITVTFSEGVTGFVIGDITVTNGTAGSFVAVSGSVYTATITPTTSGTVTVGIAAGVCQDGGGNGNTVAVDLTRIYAIVPVLTVTTLDDYRLSLAWTDTAIDETDYRIYRSTDGVAYTYVATVTAGVTSYIDTGRDPDTLYYYKVTAYNGTSEEGFSNADSDTTDAFVPSDIANLLAWYDASTGLLQDSGGAAAGNGDPVGEWQDQSGNGYHMVDPATSRRPTLRTNQINSQPALEFNGTAHALANSALGSVLAGNDKAFTTFMVLQPAATGALRLAFALTSSSSPNPLHEVCRLNTDGTFQTLRRDDAVSLVSSNTSNIALSNGSTYIVGEAFTGIRLKSFAAGQPGYGGDYFEVGNASFNRATLGAWYYQTNFNFFYGGLIAEVVVYSGNMSSLNMDRIARYLATKYDVTHRNNLASINQTVTPVTLPTIEGGTHGTHPSLFDAGVGEVWPSAGTPQSRYWMAYTPYTNSDSQYENPSIVTSSDLDTWVSPAGIVNPIDSYPGAGNYNSDTELVDGNDGSLYCFYRETNGATADYIRCRHSTDGITWSSEVAVFTDGFAESLSPAISWDGTQWVMYTVNITTNPNTLERRTSNALLSGWSAPVTLTINNLPGGRDLWHTSVNVLPNGSWVMWADVCDLGTTGVSAVLYGAQSADGMVWDIDPWPMFIQSWPGGWDDDRIYRTTAVLDNGTWQVLYSGYNGSLVWKIGHVSGHDTR